jgi:chromosome segregation ATPase
VSAASTTTAAATATDCDNEEKTMLWSNVAELFAKFEQTETDLQTQREYYDTLTRGTDELYQELQDTKNEIAQLQHDISQKNMSSAHVVRKLKKYVNTKCETVSYGAFNADNEVFAYIDKIRAEFDGRITKLEAENEELRQELSRCHETYDDDYTLFIERENDMMAKLSCATQMAEKLNERVKQHEATLMTQIQKGLNCAEQHQHKIAGDLREEFARAITREIEMESNVGAKLVQSVNDELTDIITRSNEYHTARYYGLVDDLKTLKQSIGMVDAELSDVKETVEFLKDEVAQSSNDVYDMKEELTEWKDDIYSELDRDYYDLKDYVRHRIHRHDKQKHAAANTAEPCIAAEPSISPRPAPTEHIIIIDENTVFSDDEEFEHT